MALSERQLREIKRRWKNVELAGLENDVDALVAEVRRLQREIKEWRGSIPQKLWPRPPSGSWDEP